jgi:thiamine monophosphate synthase
MENLTEVLSAGARRCVIVSQLLTAEDVTKSTTEAKIAIS